MSINKQLLLLALTTIAKLGFGIFFTTGATFHHSDSYHEAIEFCLNIGSSYYDNIYCYVDFVRGLLITGAILFFISILLEAFGPNKILIGGTIVPTIFHAIGSLFLIISSMYQILVVRDYDLYYELPDFEAGFWIAGGLITVLGQAYLAFVLRSEGLFVVVTYFFAGLGSLMFMVAGIMMLQDVTVKSGDVITEVLIAGSVFYIVHGILYPIATYKKIKELTTNEENPSVTVTNPDNVRDVDEC